MFPSSSNEVSSSIQALFGIESLSREKVLGFKFSLKVQENLLTSFQDADCPFTSGGPLRKGGTSILSPREKLRDFKKKE